MKESSFMKRINTKKSAVISLIVLLCFGIGYYVLAISPHQIAVQSFNEVIAKIEKENRKDKPLDENLTVKLKNEVSTVEKKKQVIPKIKKKTSDINKQVKSLKNQSTTQQR